ncbi:hypothetical protein TG4357_02318 [Thalassovita gelatinovora]|uniref:Uncharacterized protein n=1 Tax=Thalassovita gelatinovora TaxID=53501 RepID=A0A0P1FDK4_THAGE|nr:DUF6732 family protein [Thalassovita gelatinovora]QIZ81432.1 hypothetical protein HFZ77_13575 [Thalassovita gelatinovora]CUH66233.1 hypothetical protein TG4357_02318 [Thalassovita gelatinovora]SEQ22143.1 hypothetical protein SAMN04488043_10449 [Thalassovita gelatinovora]
MKIFYAIAVIVWAGQAAAHPGHLAEVAGHGHWLAGVAIGAAIAIGLWAGLKGKPATDAETDDSDDAPEEELQDA